MKNKYGENQLRMYKKRLKEALMSRKQGLVDFYLNKIKIIESRIKQEESARQPD